MKNWNFGFRIFAGTFFAGTLHVGAATFLSPSEPRGNASRGSGDIPVAVEASRERTRGEARHSCLATRKIYQKQNQKIARQECLASLRVERERVPATRMSPLPQVFSRNVANFKKIFCGIFVAGTLIFAGCATTQPTLFDAMNEKPRDDMKIAQLVRENPDARTPTGATCLHYAISQENYELAELLASNGARLELGEIHALFQPYSRRTDSRRYKFLSPIFPEKMKERSREYTCVAGDTLNRIATKRGCSPQELKTLNPDVDFNKLKKGQKLFVPAK